MLSTAALHSLDRALLGLRRFFAAPPTIPDGGSSVDLSTLLVLDAVLGRADGSTATRVSDVARELAVAPSTASRLVDRAVAAGAVEKVRGSADARLVNLRATAVGIALAARARAHRHGRLAGLLDDWTALERDDLVRSLEHLAAAVRAKASG